MFFSSKKEETPVPQITIPSAVCPDYEDTTFIHSEGIVFEQDSSSTPVETQDENVEVTDETQEEVEEEQVEEDYDSEDDFNEVSDDIVYIILYNNNPVSFHKTFVEAKSKVDSVVKKYSFYCNLNFYDTLVNYKSDREIDIIRSVDFILFSYNYIVHNIRIHKVYSSDKYGLSVS